MANESPLKSYIMRDLPQNSDSFEAKGHENLANSIIKLMKNEKNGGITIGLEGEWGSGKSTVIEILKNKLDPDPQPNQPPDRQEDPKTAPQPNQQPISQQDQQVDQTTVPQPNQQPILQTDQKQPPVQQIEQQTVSKQSTEITNNSSDFCVFIFDAWEYEDEPLRLAFLINLCKKLRNKKWLIFPQKSLYDIYHAAGLQVPIRINVWFCLFVFLCFLVLSILYLLFSRSIIITSLYDLINGALSAFINTWGSKLTIDSDNVYDFFIKILFPIFSYILLNWIAIHYFGFNISNKLLGTFGITNIPDISSETPDPNAIVFKMQFEKLLKGCFSKGNRKLVIVIDNLDRVSSDTALSIISTLQIFTNFDHNSPSK
jgi:hypothetical protein